VGIAVKQIVDEAGTASMRTGPQSQDNIIAGKVLGRHGGANAMLAALGRSTSSN
jgi:hypothetical protein